MKHLGYVRGNVANHQDYDVFSKVHHASGNEIAVTCCSTSEDPGEFVIKSAYVNFRRYSKVNELFDMDILDVSEFYRDYSIEILEKFKGKITVTVFDNLPFGISNGSAGLLSVRASKVIARTPMIKRMLELEGVDADKIVVVPSAVDTELFKPGIATNQYPRVLFVGRVVPEKGLWDLIVAMSGMKAELMVVGAGDTRPFINLADKCNVQADFLGEVHHLKLPEIMKQASVLVAPSIPKIDTYNPSASWVEQFGVVLLEAMSSGLPVIVSDTGSTRDIILDGKTGFLFPPRSWDILREYLKQLLESYSLRNEMGSRGRERVIQLFSTEKVGAKLAEVYLSI